LEEVTQLALIRLAPASIEEAATLEPIMLLLMYGQEKIISLPLSGTI
jgi:hypothetical protein